MLRKVLSIILVLVLVIMNLSMQVDCQDVILDTSYIYGGVNNLSGWSIGFQWMGEQEEFRDDVLSGGFTRESNAIGSFSLSLPLDEYALNLLGDTVVRIYYDGEPQFWGFIENIDIDEASGTVNVVGGDMIKKMSMRKVEYQSATAGGADPPRGDVDSKTVFEELIHWWTGESATDSMFRNEFIEWSETSYRYNYDGNNLADALSDIAFSCSLTVGDKKHVGYSMWVDGYGDIYLQPYGAREYPQEIAGQWRLSLDWGTIKNRIHLRGGRPEAFELVELEQDNYSYDMFETSTQLATWSNLTLDQSKHIMGLNSAVSSSVEFDDPAVETTCSKTFSPVKNWGYTDEHGTIQTIVSGTRISIHIPDSLTTTEYFLIDIRLLDSTPDTATGRIIEWSTWAAAVPIEWTKGLLSIDEWSVDSGFDWSDIEKIQVFITGGSQTLKTHDIYFDGFAMYFKKVDVWKRDNTSIAIHGIKEAKFQDGRTTDWATGELMTQQILDLLKNPAVTANTSVPYYDPNLYINDLVKVPVEGVTWPLYVNKLEVSWTGDHVSTTINAGRPVPTVDRIEQVMHVLRDQDQETGGVNYQVADSYESSSCVKDKERYCRTDCQATNCQNEMQLQACYTYAERDPCIATCQRYKERTGWLNRILES